MAQGSVALTENVNSPVPEVTIVATAHQLTLTSPAWSLRWAAPEVLNAEETLSLSSDAWSAGWVCWEVGNIGRCKSADTMTHSGRTLIDHNG